MTFECLSQNTNIFGKQFLEASAGTGKTFAIEHLYVRLLLEGDNPLSIEQILTVTFTRAATRELKARIRKNLENILYLLKNESILEPPLVYDYLKPFFLKKEKTIKRLKENLTLFDEAEIYTIHGFCYRMLSLYPFESRTAFNITEKIKQRKLIKKIIMKYFRSTKNFTSAQIASLLKQYDFSSLIQKIITTPSIDKEKYPSFIEYCSQFNNALSSWEEKVSIEDILIDYPVIENSYRKEKKQKKQAYINQLSFLSKLLSQKQANQEEFEEILKSGLSFFKFISDDNRKKNVKDLKLKCFAFFEFVKRDLYPIVLEALDHKKIFHNLCLDLQKEIKRDLDADDIVLPDDILIKMEKALAIEEFKQKARQKYEAVIIDEFQDTDAIQWKIFQKLFAENDLKAFYLVGDPKQSIYSFRKADLYTYLNASTYFDKISVLDTNFRSTPKLVEGLNFIFSKDFSGEWLKLPLLKKSLPYLEVKAGKTESFDFKDGNLPLHFFVGQESENTKYRSIGQLEEDLVFPYIANEIVRLINDCQILQKDIAILVNDRFQAKKIKQFLQKNNINAFSKTSFPLAKTEAALALKDFLLAVINYQELRFLKIALMGPFACFADRELTENNLEKAFFIFGKLNELLQKKGLAFFFAEFFNISFSHFTIYERMIRNDLTFYFNTMQLIELIIEEEGKKRFSYESLISFFENLHLIDIQDDERLNVRPPLDTNSVQIMTIHMSKGLEFDIVFALGLISRYAKDDFQEENEAEKLRALYVAMTRAKKRLYVPVPILENKTKEPSSIELFLGNDKQIDETIFSKLDLLKKNNYASYEIVKSLEVQSLKEQKLSFSFKKALDFLFEVEKKSIFSFSFLANQRKETFDKKEAYNLEDFPAGPEVGVLFHKIFEQIFIQKKGKEKIKNIVMEEVALNPIVNSDIVFSLVQKALRIPLIEGGFSLANIKEENIIVEGEFLFSQDPDYIKGFMDLVFFHEGKYYLLDWKTNFLGISPDCYEKQFLENEMKKHDYFLQAAIYSLALCRYLQIIDSRPFEEIFGGIFYFFIRGMDAKSRGIYHFIPDIDLNEKEIQKRINYVR